MGNKRHKRVAISKSGVSSVGLFPEQISGWRADAWHAFCTTLKMSLAADSPSARGAASEVGAAWTQRLQLLLQSTGEGIFGIDTLGRCTFINRAGAQILGWRVDQVLGRNMHSLIHHTHGDGGHYPEADCPIFNAFRQGLPCRIDREMPWRADGSKDLSHGKAPAQPPVVEPGLAAEPASSNVIPMKERSA